MIRLVRPSGKTKPVGEKSELFHSRQQYVQKGDHAEITNRDGETLNIAKVTSVTVRDGIEVLEIEMIA